MAGDYVIREEIAVSNDNRGKSMYCSVLFVDMVGYSKKTNAEQMQLKQQFVSAWEEAIRDIPAEDVMIVDSGDGAALTALKDAEDTLRVAKTLCRQLAQEKAKNPASQFQLRMGIHFGPVELSSDVNGNACIVGDAINVASRVMGFTGANQLLVSRSYYELIRPLSKDNEEAFHSFGTQNDKHERAHELYEYIGPGSSPAPKSANRQEQQVRSTAENIEPAPIVAEKKKDALASLPGTLFSFVRGIFSTLWYRIKYLIRVSVILLVIYELFVFVPIMDKPAMLKNELNQQSQSFKTIFQFGNQVVKDASRTLNGNSTRDTAPPAKNSQDKSQK